MSDPRTETAEARLWRALKRLTTINSFLQTGAHPDDESSALLARLSLGDGVRTGYACALRGEGGQNAIGPETGTALGVLRTLEMQAAARVLGIDLYWLNEDLEGPIRDFGFAKSPEAAFAVWGRERVAERLVRAIRVHRPDAIMPSFLDVPGQHGHHRAVTQATIDAFHCAGDRASFPAHATEGIAPWQPAKLYLPAWSGAGSTYDDDAPPPRTTLTIEAGLHDAVLSATYAQVGEWSRANHASQGMGVARDTGAYPVKLHRLAAREAWPEDETSPFDGLPRTLGDLAATLPGSGAAPAPAALREADHAIERALAAFPRRREVAAAVHAALAGVRRAQAALPPAATDAAARLATKVRQLAIASREALLPEARCTIARATIVPGASVGITVEPGPQPPDGIVAAMTVPPGFAVEPSESGSFRVTAPQDAAFTSPYRFAVLADAPLSPIHGILRYTLDGVAVEAPVDATPAIAVVPAASLSVAATAIAWNLEAPPAPTIAVELRAAAGEHRVTVEAPPHWPVAPASAGATLAADGTLVLSFTVLPPRKGVPRQATVRLAVDGAPAQSVTRITHPRLGSAILAQPAQVALRSLRVQLPQGRIAYVDGGFDKNWHWLRQVGLAIDLIADSALRDLASYDTVVVGVFAFRTRPALRAALAPLKAWMQAGGNLVTLYHRPQDGWDPDQVPPHRLRIGQPSLRWRVCDPQAPVTVLAPDHPLLDRPNKIEPADWTGWVRERGLYFAAEWAPDYVPLLALGDPGETPLTGSLLTARVGSGRHTHVSLALHHQLPALVPGAYRLFANLLSPARF